MFFVSFDFYPREKYFHAIIIDINDKGVVRNV